MVSFTQHLYDRCFVNMELGSSHLHGNRLTVQQHVLSSIRDIVPLTHMLIVHGPVTCEPACVCEPVCVFEPACVYEQVCVC
jgi:hypothetical protein